MAKSRVIPHRPWPQTTPTGKVLKINKKWSFVFDFHQTTGENVVVVSGRIFERVKGKVRREYHFVTGEDWIFNDPPIPPIFPGEGWTPGTEPGAWARVPQYVKNEIVFGFENGVTASNPPSPLDLAIWGLYGLRIFSNPMPNPIPRPKGRDWFLAEREVRRGVWERRQFKDVKKAMKYASPGSTLWVPSKAPGGWTPYDPYQNY
jgi:hypothetical protein